MGTEQHGVSKHTAEVGKRKEKKTMDVGVGKKRGGDYCRREEWYVAVAYGGGQDGDDVLLLLSPAGREEEPTPLW